jgi:hypothetical protein
VRRYVIPDGLNYEVAIREMVFLELPAARFKMAPTDRALPYTLIYEDLDDPSGEAAKLAIQVGMRLYRRGNRITVRVPLKWQIGRAWYLYVADPADRVWQRTVDRIKDRAYEWSAPPPEYPDPDYSD